MSRTIAVLIRHADYNQLPDTPSAHQLFGLNKVGRKQAKNAVILLNELLQNSNAKFDPVINSSYLLRSWQTAEIIEQGINCIDKVDAYESLAERGLGNAANLTIQQIETIIEEDSRYAPLPENWKSNSHYCLPFSGAESLIDAGIRVANHLQQAMQSLQQRVVKQDTYKIFVGHGAAFRHAAYHLNILEYEQIAQLSMYHAQPIAFEYRADGIWQHLMGEWKVRKNSTGYLD